MQAPAGAAQAGAHGAAQLGAQAAAGAAQAGAAGAQQVSTGAQQLSCFFRQLPRPRHLSRMLFAQPRRRRSRLTLQHFTGAQQASGAGAQQAGAAGAAQAGAQAAAGAAQAGAQAAAGAAQAGAQAFPQGAAQFGAQAAAAGAAHPGAHGAAQLGAASQQVGAGAQHPPRPNRPASATFTLAAISRAAVKVVHFILKSPRLRPGFLDCGVRRPVLHRTVFLESTTHHEC